MTTVTMYHNPNCSKSRQTLALLRERGIEPIIVEYLTTPPNSEELESILHKLSLQPRELMRQKESIYAKLSLADPTLTRAALINAMIEHPILIERPIVLANGTAALGRPPENVLSIVS